MTSGEVAVVVAAAIVERCADGLLRVLAAQRGRPAALAGRWELPGGKVEPGEPEPAAVIRECAEELGVQVAVGDRIGNDLPIPGGRVLRVYAASLTAGDPHPYEHTALRWLPAADLDGVDWLPADRPLLPELRRLLSVG